MLSLIGLVWLIVAYRHGVLWSTIRFAVLSPEYDLVLKTIWRSLQNSTPARTNPERRTKPISRQEQELTESLDFLVANLKMHSEE